MYSTNPNLHATDASLHCHNLWWRKHFLKCSTHMNHSNHSPPLFSLGQFSRTQTDVQSSTCIARNSSHFPGYKLNGIRFKHPQVLDTWWNNFLQLLKGVWLKCQPGQALKEVKHSSHVTRNITLCFWDQCILNCIEIIILVFNVHTMLINAFVAEPLLLEIIIHKGLQVSCCLKVYSVNICNALNTPLHGHCKQLWP